MPINADDAAAIARAVRDNLLEMQHDSGRANHEAVASNGTGSKEDRVAAANGGSTPALQGGERGAGEAVVAAARACLFDAVSRCLSKQSLQAGRAAKPGGDFDKWLGSAWVRLRDEMATAIAPALALLRATSSDSNCCDAETVAATLCAEAKLELQRAYDSESPALFAKRLSRWPSERASEVTDRIMQGSLENANAI